MPLDRPQFRALFDAERDRVHRFLFRLCRNAADADDLLQEAFLMAWRHRTAFDARGSAAGWLMRTAFRTYLNAQRKRARRGALEQGRLNGSRPAAAADLENREALDFVLAKVRAAVDELPEGPREAFLMFRFEGLRVAEIAEISGAPLKTVETRIRRATLLLAERLGALRQHLPTS